MTDLPMTEDGYDSIMVTVDHVLSKGIILSLCTKKGLNSERTGPRLAAAIDKVGPSAAAVHKELVSQGVRDSFVASQKQAAILPV